MRIAYNFVGFKLERQPKIPDASRHIRLDENILGLKVPVGDGGLEPSVPGGGDLCVEVGEAGGNAQTEAT